METRISSLGQGPGLAWKRNSSSFPPGSLAELQEWTGGNPPWHGEVDFQQWNTIGWGVNNDGVLCIKPWNGDTGETGPVTISNRVPWDGQRSKIKKVESIGDIVLNKSSAYLFYYCSSLTNLTALANWDVSKVTDMSCMFYGCSNLYDLTALKDWGVSNVTNMSGMFNACSNLTDLTPLAGWNVSKVTNMSYSSSRTDLRGLKNWNVYEVTDMNGMFASCFRLTDLRGLENWNVSEVTNMGGMFSSCSSLTNLTPLARWNVSKVTNMYGMFQFCSQLTDLTSLKDWNVSNVTNMSYMFYRCSNLQKVGIPSIENGGQKLVENAEPSGITDAMPSIVSEDGAIGPFTWPELSTEMTTNPGAFQDGTVWVRA